jgi:hypothetical protein
MSEYALGDADPCRRARKAGRRLSDNRAGTDGHGNGGQQRQRSSRTGPRHAAKRNAWADGFARIGAAD